MSTQGSASAVKQLLLEQLSSCQQQLQELAEALPESLDELASAEQQIRETMLRIGRELLQLWSEVADARVSVPDCETCQHRMRHKGYVCGSLATTLGNLRVRRVRFRCESCGQESYPHDQSLRFLGHGVSRALGRIITRLGAQLTFGEAQQNLEADYGVHLCKQTVQFVCEEAGLSFLAAEDQERQKLQALPPAEQPAALPDSPLSPEKTYVHADGTMIHSEGDWHEIRVASVASYAQDESLLAVDHRARFLSCEDLGYQLVLLARRAGYHRSTHRAFIADGAHWLWEIAATHFPDAHQILDWYHLSEHVHQAAAVLHGEKTAQAKRFSDARLKELWEGRAAQTLRRLKEIRKQVRAPTKRETLRQLITYLENNRQRIRYPTYRALGLNVGSGRVESACKMLVGARCKQAGMRNWSRSGAEGVLRIRAALKTGQFNQLWKTPANIAL